MASELSVDDILQSKILMRQFGIHSFVLAQSTRHFFHTLQIGGLHATVLGFPIAVGGIADAVTPANVFHFGAGIGFL